jgi:pentatricopeptide repeat protein
MLGRMSGRGKRVNPAPDATGCLDSPGGANRAVSRGASASTLAYNLVMGCLSRAGRHAEAEALMGTMQRDGVPPDAVTFSSLISLAPAASTAPSRAAEWLSAMKEMGVAPDVQVSAPLENGPEA